MSDERRPRSRFDSDEPERPARSRFDSDRRSRSPSRKESESHRERSPVAREGSDSSAATAAAAVKSKAAAAAAAAARINAQIQAKKGIQHVDVPPIRSVRATIATFPHRTLTNKALGAYSSGREAAYFQFGRPTEQRDIPARW